MNHPPSAGLRHLALRVKNLNRMRKFYVDTLGYAVEWEPDPDNLYLSSGADNLALHQVSGELGAGSLDHLGIVVQRPEDVDAWASYLKSQGVSLKQEPKTHRDGARSIYFADPEENVIQILYHPPISGK
ncbi:MAG TPA: VOC family protein [Acidobacteriota bacterium]|nr:VOC family protein [Acidobacteriota bacterium]